MLFTQFLKSKEISAANTDRSNSSEFSVVEFSAQPGPEDSLVIKPTSTGIISNKESPQPSILEISFSKNDCEDLFVKKPPERGRILSNIHQTMKRVRDATPTKLLQTPVKLQEAEDSMQKMQTEKSQVKIQSRIKQWTQQKASSSRCSQFSIGNVGDDKQKLCIGCDRYICVQNVTKHQNECSEFPRLLKMNKNQLFMFVHEKIMKETAKKQRFSINARKGLLIGDPSSLIAGSERRISDLHRVRNGIMTRLH